MGRFHLFLRLRYSNTCYRTLIDSTPGVLKAWDTFCKDYSLDTKTVAHATHGRRLYDTLKEFCRIDDEDKLQVPSLITNKCSYLHHVGGNYPVRE